MTLPRSERGPEMTRSVELDAAPAEVWDALTEEALLAEWLADEVEIEAEPAARSSAATPTARSGAARSSWSRRPNGSPGAGGAKTVGRAGWNWCWTRSPSARA